MWSTNATPGQSVSTPGQSVSTPTRSVSTPSKFLLPKTDLKNGKTVEKVEEMKDDEADPNFSICTDEDSFEFGLQNSNNTV